METTGAVEQQSEYDRFKELKAFEESKAGVKGLVDAGIVKIPQMFIRPLDELTEELDHTEHENSNFEIPLIDIKSVDLNDHLRHKEVIDEVRRASETCGFFRLVNHGIPLSVMGEIVKDTIAGLLSEALGLKQDHLKRMYLNCLVLSGHYYPACPEPELTLGTSTHSDPSFFTILLQDHIGGLQFLHQDQWVTVKPIPGDLIVNIGDLLQLISNDKFKGAEHRVLANVMDQEYQWHVF
ncbi:hypothetical protein C5167_023865 [Papaver somniferum]|uniref:Fe2OG dioxygenase domain-containing protein n=1 Tax=Papaver somniferum TaxID=3469 RepID=A0A4Y7JPZ2_PAPSO|nr:hypothetical protein C5167_023865 [Papaver somniferum]